MESGQVFERLIHLAGMKGLQVKFAPLEYSYGRLDGDRVGIANNLGIELINHTLAHEIAHAYLHHDKGNIVDSKASYEEQAERAAMMLLDMVRVEETV